MREPHAFLVECESVKAAVDIRTVREALVTLYVPEEEEVEIVKGMLKTGGVSRTTLKGGLTKEKGCLREIKDREELQTMLFRFVRATTDRKKIAYVQDWGLPEGAMEISIQRMENQRQLLVYTLAIAEALRERNEDHLFGPDGFFTFGENMGKSPLQWKLTWDRPAFENKAVVLSNINSKTGERSSNCESVSVLCGQQEERFDAVAYVLKTYLVNPRAQVRARLMQEEEGIHIQLAPESHLAALWFAVMRSISGEASEYRVCPQCGRAFPRYVWVDKPSEEKGSDEGKKRVRTMIWNRKAHSWECFLCRKAREERERRHRRREERRAREEKASSEKK